MKSNLFIILIAIIGGLLGLLAGSHFNGDGRWSLRPGVVLLKPGDVRPDLALPDTTGKLRHLSDWNGTIVLLNFWAPWCNPCRTEMPLLNAAYSKRGLEVIGIAVDDPQEVRDYLKEHPVSFPVLLANPEYNLSREFGNPQDAFPYSVLVGRDGKVIAQKLGEFEPGELKGWLATNIAQAD